MSQSAHSGLHPPGLPARTGLSRKLLTLALLEGYHLSAPALPYRWARSGLYTEGLRGAADGPLPRGSHWNDLSHPSHLVSTSSSS